MKKYPFYFILSAILLTGCGPIVRVDVDSICSPIAKEKSKYVLIPGNENCSHTDLQFMEFANYTDNALQDLGFTKASSQENAELAIMLFYGISDPHFYQYTYSVPVWGQTGIESSSSSGIINTCGNSTIYSGSTSYKPSYGVVGSTTHLGTGVLFTRHLTLIGVDLEKYKESNDIVEIWSTKATSVGPLGDLRKIFPILLAASKHHIASSTGEKVSYELKEDDKRVKEVKRIGLPDSK
jgi:hypothetical protein